ncbi:MFS transporter [Sphingobium sp.]|uniref:MFS transporter n=1 Tax=Sphingobium sp. TaxID=1912891 RepID=UPI0035C71E26
MHISSRLSARRIALFSLPVVLFQAIEIAWRSYLPQHLTANMGLSLAATGILMMAMRSLDAVADPAMGWISDHVETRYGRRRPWMMLGVPLIAIGSICLFASGPGLPLFGIVLASVALHLGYSLILTPHGGWGLEIGRDTHERTRLMSAKIWYASAGATAILSIAALLERGFDFGKAAIAAILGSIVALLAPLSVGPVVVLFRERTLPHRKAGGQSIRGSLRAIMSNPALRKPLALYLWLGIADASSATAFLFLSDNVLQLPGWGAALMLIQPVLVMMTLPLWTRASGHYGRERVLIWAYGWQFMVAPLALWLPVGSLSAMIAYLLARNLVWGVDYALLRAMVADAADQDIRQGTSRSGLYYGLSSITLKLAMGLGASGTLWFISLSGFDARSPFLPADAQLAIRIAFAAPSTIAAAAALKILSSRRRTRHKMAPSVT